MVEKNIVLKEETWLKLGKLKRFPERASFDAVIVWLLEEQQAREETKELLK